MSSDWLHTLFDGAAGGIIGALGAYYASVRVVKKQSESDRALFQQQMDVEAKRNAMQVLLEYHAAVLQAYNGVGDSGPNPAHFTLPIWRAGLFAAMTRAYPDELETLAATVKRSDDETTAVRDMPPDEWRDGLRTVLMSHYGDLSNMIQRII